MIQRYKILNDTSSLLNENFWWKNLGFEAFVSDPMG